MRVDLTSPDDRLRTRRSDDRKSTPILDALEDRLLLSADFKAFATNPTVVSGIDANVDVAYYATSPTGHVDAATIDWGDGSATTSGTVSPLGTAFPGSVGNIEGDHAYAATGSYTVKTTLIEHVTGGPDVTSTVSGTIHVVTPTVTAQAAPTILGAQGQVITDQVVATISTNIPSADKSFKVTIDWGDGTTTSSGTISSSLGLELGDGEGPEHGVPSTLSLVTSDLGGHHDGLFPYAVTGSHTYATAGSYKATVTIDDGAGHTASASTPVTIGTSTLVATSPSSLNAVSGVAISVPLAKVVDIASGATIDPSSLSATIDWGDGTTPSTGEVHGGGHFLDGSTDQPTYSISGSHTYAQAGDETVTITVTDKNGRTATATTTIHAQSETITATGTSISATTGVDQIYQVTTGTDAPIVRGNHLSATIDWGDGSTPTTGRVLSVGGFPFLASSQSLSSTSNPFIVVGDHQYATAGTYTVHVTITSDSGATASADSTATVTTFSAFGIPKFGHAGTAITSEPVAAISIPGASAAATDFTATIDWGDGSATDTGTILSKNLPQGPWIASDAASRSVLLVDGSHTYATAGNYTAKITIKDTATGESTVVSSNVTIFAASATTGDGSVDGTLRPPSTGTVNPIGIVVNPGVPGTVGGGVAGVAKVVTTPPASSTATVTSPATATPSIKKSNKAPHAKKVVKVTHHAKALVKARANHPHGPLG